ncbi:MAG: hydrogenase maturation peptidase HycI [Candidatus Margulisbacteria bacterium]|nr:hydrogenase maturation peptidase HycI [Candidatus Margulisiibacteriota bacterium]
MLSTDIQDALNPEQNSKLLIITVGNDFRADDGVGPYIAQAFPNGINDNIYLINAGQQPENFIDQATDLNPEKIIIVDAAYFQGEPGECRLFTQDYIPETTLTTHIFPLKALAGILAADTKAEVLFLGIQPISTELGQTMSVEVKKNADEIIDFLNSR